MRETPRRFNVLRPVAVLALALGSVAVVDVLNESPTQQQAAEQTATKPWLNVSFILPKISTKIQEGIVSESLHPWQKTPVFIEMPTTTTTTTITAPPPTATTTTAPLPPTSFSTETASDGLTDAEIVGWTNTANCEEPGGFAYYAEGPNYYGSIGISGGNWLIYGPRVPGYGATFDRTNATPEEQMEVAEEIQSSPPTWPGEPSCADYKGW
jgi:hypothetical protein